MNSPCLEGLIALIDKRHKFCFGEALLTGTILASASLGYWLASKTEGEKAADFYRQYTRLILKNEITEARKLHKQALSAGGDLPLTEIWLPLVQAQDDGYDKLYYYLRILAGNKDREETYEEIAELISRSPQAFNEELKNKYLEALYEIPGIRRDFIEKYGLQKD